MKLSLKFQDDPLPDHHHHHHHHNQNPILKAKVPISIFNQPFISSTTTTTTTSSPSDISFSLSTNFPTGPSLKLSYSPTTTTSPTPFSITLKSGLGLFGSPHNSPLIFSADFSLSQTNTPIPTFSLHFKPQFGDFSLKKSTFSNPGSDQISGFCSNGGAKLDSGSYGVNLDSGLHSKGEFGSGFASDGSSVWQELKLETFSGKDGVLNPDCIGNSGVHSSGEIGFVPGRSLALKNSGKDGFLSGVAVTARTVFPVTKRVMMNMRWGVNFPADLGKRMPYLTLNKIGIERVEEVKEVEKKKSAESNVGDSELLKGICFWMRRDLEVLEKENKEMKQSLEEMRMGTSVKGSRGERHSIGNKMVFPSGESSSEFERWRSKKSGGEENGRRESKKSTNLVSDWESELQRAIKSASS